MPVTTSSTPTATIPFCRSAPLTLGVELEFGIVDPDGLDLTAGAPILVAALARDGFDRHVKAEVTSAMIEVNSSVHQDVASLGDELLHLTSTLDAYARRFGMRIVGGGTHPFQNWPERTIFPARRFQEISHTYGYLAQQFTVFGQHVHVGCTSGDDAIYLTHALTRYTPLLIALSASSPYYRGVDTGFACCRLNVVNAFPLSGTAPLLRSWKAFGHFFDEMRRRHVVTSMKDFYWDVRPKPEFGTVEVRVCDTPLSVIDAVDIAGLVQALAAELLQEPRRWADENYGCIYSRNKFQACRFGLDGEFIDVDQHEPESLRDMALVTLARLRPHFQSLRSLDTFHRLIGRVRHVGNDATWMRGRIGAGRNLPAVVLEMSDRLLAAA